LSEQRWHDPAPAGEIDMNAKRRRRAKDHDRDKRARARREEALDDALKNTFPASDPVSIEQPAPPEAGAKRGRFSRHGPR
jgi:hypothetical protein